MTIIRNRPGWAFKKNQNFTKNQNSLFFKFCQFLKFQIAIMGKGHKYCHFFVIFVNRYRTVCRLRAMRIFVLEFISENEELSRKRRGAKCLRGDLWRTFFSSPASVKDDAFYILIEFESFLSGNKTPFIGDFTVIGWVFTKVPKMDELGFTG